MFFPTYSKGTIFRSHDVILAVGLSGGLLSFHFTWSRVACPEACEKRRKDPRERQKSKESLPLMAEEHQDPWEKNHMFT